MDQTSLMQMFPDGSGNLRMENFSPAWYLIENHRETKLSDLRKGLSNLILSTKEGEKSSADLHRANLYSLINCVDTLAALHDKMQIEKNTRGWPLTRNISDKLEESHTTANAVFHEVLARKDRADATRNALSVLTRFRFIFFLSSAIDQNLAKVTTINFKQKIQYCPLTSAFMCLCDLAMQPKFGGIIVLVLEAR
ncbi:unnamed protein product [Gongylonema pulchrum]|uniref:Exocyst complex component 2 n=1 Tax=Gongylonema pulchrum TaxID=637853 RepID=A0A183EMW6_9BILA|nr:unnamed protein product [Gongylonema pulchrum]